MSGSSACPHCQQPLAEGFIGRACPHCGGALTNKRKRSLSGFSFQAVTPAMAGSSRPPGPALSSAPPREFVEDRWDLPAEGDPARLRPVVPAAAPTGFPAVTSSNGARHLRSTMALGVQVPTADATEGEPPAAPVAATVRAPGAEALRSTAALDPFAWNLDQSAAPPSAPPRSALDVRVLKQTALGVAAAPSRPVSAPPVRPVAQALRQTALGIAPQPAEGAALLEIPEEVPEAAAFPLVRSTTPPPAASSRPPPSADASGVPVEDIDIPSGPLPSFGGGPLGDASLTPSALSHYAPLRAPPSLRPAPVAAVAWWWAAGGGALVLAAAMTLRTAPFAVALRVAAAASALLMMARFGALSMRALLLLLVALPALAQETLSVASLSRAGAAVLTGALVLLPTGAWLPPMRRWLRRTLLVAGAGLALAAAVMPGGVARPWTIGAAPVLALACVSLMLPARWVSAALTAVAMAWAAACGVSGVVTVPTAATGVAMAVLTLLTGRALATVLENKDEG